MLPKEKVEEITGKQFTDIEFHKAKKLFEKDIGIKINAKTPSQGIAGFAKKIKS